MPRSKDEDRELQIELTKLQIQYEEAHSNNTVLLSIVASTLLATVSVFGTLLATTDDLWYGYLSIVIDVPLFLFTIVIVKRARKVHEDLDYDIKKLKDRFLSKQAEEKKQASKCDLVVCWINDWHKRWTNEKCPLAVFEVGGGEG